jgi:hypothetical protein
MASAFNQVSQAEVNKLRINEFGSGLLARVGHCGCNHIVEYILPSFDAALEISGVKVLK